jgi:hypothetical protein
MLPAAQYINFTHTVRGTLSFCSPTDHQELSRPIYFERVCECYISSVLRDRPFVLQNHELQEFYPNKSIHISLCTTSMVLSLTAVRIHI